MDEPEILERAVHIIKTGDFNPHFFDYPSLYIYLQALVAIPRFIWGALSGEWSTLASAPTSAFYVWARAVTATLGTATVYLVYRCARRWDEPTALVAAGIMAVVPLHVRESHFALTDVPVTFFVALTWLLSLAAHRRPAAWRFVVAGAAAGLATATKWNAVFAIVMPLLACTAPVMRRSRLQAVAIVGGACGAAFLIATPYTVLDLPAFLDGFARLAAAYKGPSPAQAPAITYAKHLRNAVGWPAVLFGVAGLLLAIVRIVRGPDRTQWALAILFPVVYYVFIARQHIVFARYLLPAVPFVAVLGAAAIVAAWRWIGARSPRAALVVAAVLVAAAVVPGAATALQFDQEISRTWTSELAYRWILNNVPPGSRIVIESRNLLLPTGYEASNVPQLRQQSLDAYRTKGVSYLVASSQCYGPYLASPALDAAAYADYIRLFRSTEELARFTPSKQHPGSELRILKVPPASGRE